MKAKKEISVAIFIGLIIALLVAGGILRAQKALRSVELVNLKDRVIKPSPPPISAQLFLELATPDNSVTDKATITLNGKTLPGTFIAILGEKGEYLIVPNELGSFSQEITLVKGANSIKITVYENNGNKIEKTISTVYTTAEI